MTRGRYRHDSIVARFEEHLEENPGKPMHLAQICETLGVTERTFRAACERRLGMGPIRYLKLRRMQLARLALLQADPSTKTVTGIATDYGFQELGRFSVTYKSLFGESPSASLKRSVDRKYRHQTDMPPRPSHV